MAVSASHVLDVSASFLIASVVAPLGGLEGRVRWMDGYHIGCTEGKCEREISTRNSPHIIKGTC